MHSSISTKKVRSHFPVTFTVLLTFEQQRAVLDIKTYPPDRFNPVQSLISIYPTFQWDSTEQNEFQFIDYERAYEGVLVQLEFQRGEVESFMIASTYVGFREDEEIDTPWRWHHWRVSPEDASTIMSGGLKEGSPVVERAHRAIMDPNYAQTLDSQARLSRVSISAAKDCSLTLDAGAVSHMHLA
jgi:hypothetical protein